ncbi:SGNH/GDSL hydrolase family protein [Nocardioides pantholopis]|uniref:SGNH/GDSL hydrolase family protein n=1 Tax=Nocardioides pantholopis TaxID=2483798 RepID=UPI000FD7D84A|nr:SGNH/GDSL hydrolase family protein [Nocardioides pantholopis]
MNVRGVLPDRRRRVPAVLLALLAVLATTYIVAEHAIGGRPDRCERFAAASATRAGLVDGTGADVLVVGDSYAAGLLLEDPHASWPSRLDGRVRVAGFSGSGFSRGASGCGDVSFATRTAQALGTDDDLVVVQGGLNDTDQPPAAVRAGFERLVRVVGERQLVVVGPPSAPRRTGRVPAVQAQLSALCARHGVPYVAADDLELAYLDDGLHLTEAGHREFGDAVAQRIGALQR